MSKPRNIWWTYARNMIWKYPTRKQQYEDALRQSVTASYSGMPKGSGDGHSMEDQIIRTMSKTLYAEYQAVERAIEWTRSLDTGPERLELITLVYWNNPRYNVYETTKKLHIEIATAKRWHRDFVKAVAQQRGLYD